MVDTRTEVYGQHFFDQQEDGSQRSAAAMVPVIVDLLAPTSVLDVGCGVGPWLAEFASAGVAECYGIDGPWVDPDRFKLGAERLTHFDFGNATPPFRPKLAQDRFDIVTTFEFLEHVRADYAEPVVEFIASLSDTVVMSAAIPGQGGTDHVNERWIDYWTGLFRQYGFEPYDAFRPLVWHDDAIAPWYRQNTIGLFRGTVSEKIVQTVQKAVLDQLHNPPRLVHPGILENVSTRLEREHALSGLPRRFTKRIIGQNLTHTVKRYLPMLSNKE